MNVVKEKIGSIEFRVLSPELIKRMSVVKLITSELYDADGYPIEGGLMNLRMGVIEPGLRCRTCGGRVKECPGHFGYIELARPVLHIKYLEFIYSSLRSTCSHCGKICLDEKTLEKLQLKMNIVKKHQGELKSWDVSKEIISKAKNALACPYCGEKRIKIKLKKPYFFYEDKTRITPIDIRERLEKISDSDCELLGVNAVGGRPEWMVLINFPVPPVTVRPSITLESGQKSEDDLTHKLADIVRANQRLAENLNAGAPEIIIEDLWDLLQYHITTFFSNENSQIPPARHKNGRALKTLSERIKSKEGRFRKNLAGKRVNFSARSVISPDSNIKANEVGVPQVMADELTIPERVTSWNIEWLKKMIKNFPQYPCALYVFSPDGRKRKITDESKELLLEELSQGFIVERTIMDGDTVLFNRQPSLHRMSIMAHKVKVLPGNTFRINPLVTEPYNADFDGDDMNLHIPQTEEARAEADELMDVNTQIISPKFGMPTIACKQDHLSGLFILTRKGEMFSKEEAFQLLARAGLNEADLKFDKSGNVSGKEIFSCVLPKDFNYIGKSGLKDEKHEDLTVKIINGKLVSGVIDDKSIGSKKGLMLAEIVKNYDREDVNVYLQRMSLLGIAVLDMKGFTVLSSDSDLPEKTVYEIKDELKQAISKVNKDIESFKKKEMIALPGRTLRETLEQKIINSLNNARNKVGLLVLKNASSDNCSIIMSSSGAKGNVLNLAQMAGCVGQQVLRGFRLKRGYESRVLPHFRKKDLGALPRGFIKHGYKAGLNPTEFFFHGITSRDSQMDTSLRTPTSGYFQRRLINALQDFKVYDDLSVRTSDNHIIQFKSGEDGIDVSKSDAGKIDIDLIIKKVENK
ncbi:MAG: DNA-directed RNA polymerase subunit A' [Candidatus Nanoarchaeia archaeon]|nr:DNA-directed RNA polymerase subunit A' [Candidatus Nanoarchaeia archaeon]MDD5054059.1 DNA-directed RNA polymerase subunit A' [Candidatus Nanoarchaeia archaeon]MDD5499555.1 DNA-directed RNA polymerase subunit A' [Candidatus Nanoarchaeia archaeon]